MFGGEQQVGVVYLVGAGPGEPGLITLRGVECLRQANLILYDYLVNPLVLRHAPASAERVCLGRHGQGRIMPPDEVIAQMIAAARDGQTVVRLKGGDPAIFARGAEEAEALSAAGIPFEIVPGVTAALAAGSYAGIPVTHRDLASAVALVAGHEDEGKPSPLDFRMLAHFPGTLVVYMGVTTARQWTRELMAGGMPAETPAAIVRRCSWPDQLTILCELSRVADELAARKMRPPVIVIIGPVVSLAPALSWFSKRPLFGQKVLVTRPREQADELARSLHELGAEVLFQPAIEIRPAADKATIEMALDRLADFQWLVFSSANGVEHFLQRLLAAGRDARCLGSCKIAAIGPGTAAALARFHVLADLVPAHEFRAESLAAELGSQAQGQRVLLIRGSRGREVLAEQLAALGAMVEQIVVYQSTDVARPDEEIRQALAAGRIHWVTVTSSAIAQSLARLFGEDLRRARLVSISPITSTALRELGFEPAAEARQYTIEGIVQAILEGARVG
jgi:uroporphyrinogen III methyltransferase/synthase